MDLPFLYDELELVLNKAPPTIERNVLFDFHDAYHLAKNGLCERKAKLYNFDTAHGFSLKL
jgi:hypothetical protein